MGICSIPHRRNKFVVDCSAKMKELFDYYSEIVLFLRTSNFFAQKTDQLLIAIDLYLKNHCRFNPTDLPLAAIDSAHKLHPLQFSPRTITSAWLLESCLRQQKFITEFPIQLLNFDTCYNIYIQFLYLCYSAPKEIVMPSKQADFMWHAHMQDHKAYKKDMRNILGWVLNHRDDFSEESQNQNLRNTIQIRKKRYSSGIQTVLEGHYKGQKERKKQLQEERQNKGEMLNYRMSGIRGQSVVKSEDIVVYKLNESGINSSGLAQQKMANSGVKSSVLVIELKFSELAKKQKHTGGSSSS